MKFLVITCMYSYMIISAIIFCLFVFFFHFLLYIYYYIYYIFLSSNRSLSYLFIYLSIYIYLYLYISLHLPWLSPISKLKSSKWNSISSIIRLAIIHYNSYNISLIYLRTFHNSYPLISHLSLASFTSHNFSVLHFAFSFFLFSLSDYRVFIEYCGLP